MISSPRRAVHPHAITLALRLSFALALGILAVSPSWLEAQEQVSEEGPAFVFETGTPPWRGERIPLPPSFAPDLGWTGIEEIRFAPGMFDPTAETFFSYVLVFLIETDSDVSHEALEKEILTYYRGLSKAVMEGKGRTVDTGQGFSVTLAKSELPESLPPDLDSPRAYTATLDWVEPFATQQPQRLQLELLVWRHGDRPVVLSCVSPLAKDHAFWKQLGQIRQRFRFKP